MIDGGSADAVGPSHRRVPRTDTASRLITVPRERVYAALVDPDALVRWLPPRGMTCTIERFDARPGGAYRMVLSYDDPSGSVGKTTEDSDVVEGLFADIVPGVRVVQAVHFVSDDPAYGGTMTMRWELTTVDEGTRVDVTADGVPDAVSADDHAAGMASSLANLAAYLGG